MSVSKLEFANYAWHRGGASHSFLQMLENTEEMVYSQNSDTAIEEMQSLFKRYPDLPIDAGSIDLEKIGGACNPVRSVLVFALAAMKHGRMGLATSQYRERTDGPKWCMKCMFEVLLAVNHAHKTTPTPQNDSVMNFIVELMIATYESIDTFTNPSRCTDIAVSAKSANFLAISCNIVQDRVRALEYSNRAVDLIQGIDMITDKKRLAQIYQTAGICQKNSGHKENARQYFRNAMEYASDMSEFVPNKAKEDLQGYIERDIDKLSARYMSRLFV